MGNAMENLEFLTPKIIAAVFIAGVTAFFIGRFVEWLKWKRQMKEKVDEKFKKSLATRIGQSAEMISPLLPDFPFDPGDCRFIGKPIDYVVFKGSTESNITEVVFVEVKSGNNKRLNEQEARLREIIEAKRVRWAQFNVNARA